MQPKSQHVTAVELQEMWPSMFHKLFKFAIYRDPVSRFISAYAYLYEGGNQKETDLFWSQKIKKHGSFETFVRHLFCAKRSGGASITPCINLEENNKTLESMWDTNMPIHFFPQHIFNVEGKLLVDTLLHIDDLKHNNVLCFFKENFQFNDHSFAQNMEVKIIRNSSSALKKEILHGLNEETICILKEAYCMDYELVEKVTRL